MAKEWWARAALEVIENSAALARMANSFFMISSPEISVIEQSLITTIGN
jgi:hypothetical protein